MKAHPYAEAWPLLGHDELAELAEDIAANGLRSPIVTFDGLILDGRNRFAACRQAKIEPTFTEFEGTPDQALAFVQSVNNARRHQSKGSLAASWALSMLAAGKRDGGRWAYGESQDLDIHRQWRAMLGVIADYAPALLLDVRDEAMSLNAAHEAAKEARDETLRAAEAERIAAEAEAKAERFLRDSSPDLAEKVGTTYRTWLEAEAVWKVRNAEEAKRRADEERKKRDEEAAIEKGIRDALNHISNAIQFLDGGSSEGERFLRDYWPHHDRHLSGLRAITGERVDAAIDYLTTIRKATA